MHSWFNNKGRTGPTKGKLNLLQSHKHIKHKLRHDYQAYSKLFYNDHIKVHVDKAWEEALKAFESGELEDKLSRLTLTQEVTKTIFESEMAEVQAEVREYH